jgi:hypothetical protein
MIPHARTRALGSAAIVLSALSLLDQPTAHANAPIIYPSAGQSFDQQAKDETECRGWAQQNAGVSPYQTAPEYYGGGYSTPGVIGGAARGAALGAVGGAIAGDAGEGAKIGAGVGAAAGFMRRNQERRQQAQANEQANAQYQADLNRYNQAFAACMQGRGYVVR